LELQVVPINDVYGPTGYDPDIQALVVSKESVSGGDMSEWLSAPVCSARPSRCSSHTTKTIVLFDLAVTKAREERSLPPLRQYIIDVITSSAPTREGSPSAAARVVGHGDHPPTLRETEEDASKLKTLKMGSTYIREWLFRQKASQPTR
jgi:pantetheine-phosphate adenylyltransferase